MELVMCRSCGEFTRAVTEEEGVTPLRDECPKCGGVEFKHIESETHLRADN